MTWIKQNYDRFILALFAAGLVVCAGLLFNNVRGFNDVFASLKEVPPPDTTIKPVDMEGLNAEIRKLIDPLTWKVRMIGDTNDRQLPAFVSPPYIEKFEPDGKGGFTAKLVDPLLGEAVHAPVPNKWLIDNHQDMLASNVLNQDTDGDGFTTLDEYLGNPPLTNPPNSTDPNNRDSHPPYYTKLFIKQFVRVPFRLLFAARNGNIALINTIDLDSPTQFLKVGDPVKGTKFKMTKLDLKSGKEDGLIKDLSEVTLENVETHETIVLPKEKEVDSPTTYAVLSYVWNGGDLAARNEFAVKKNQEFSIKPDLNVKYKCIALSEMGVTLLKEDDNKSIDLKQLPKR